MHTHLYVYIYIQMPVIYTLHMTYGHDSIIFLHSSSHAVHPWPLRTRRLGLCTSESYGWTLDQARGFFFWEEAQRWITYSYIKYTWTKKMCETLAGVRDVRWCFKNNSMLSQWNEIGLIFLFGGVLPRKLTCPPKNRGWKTILSFWNGPF